jgi:hypothetical protein
MNAWMLDRLQMQLSSLLTNASLLSLTTEQCTRRVV